MKQYKAGNIKNIAFLGHGGSGKTTLTEALIYNNGDIERIGKTADGATVSDFEARLRPSPR